ncbi:multidrug and toxin extrusion protein 1-like [Tubulanus polymorphus]|uniref:multidrug and toxin extrusion protein 1-like n=1 Tax=Tubulanus polymorphus TaxID=672921 RepID=UPI003DA2DD21
MANREESRSLIGGANHDSSDGFVSLESSSTSQEYWKDGYRSSSNYGSTDVEERVEVITSTSSFLCIPGWFRDEAKSSLKLVWPLIMTTIFNFLQNPIALIFCGTLGPIQLGGAALAVTVINVFGTIIGVGVASALDTLVSQTYGANRKMMIGILIQRGLFIMFLTAIPCLVIHLNITTLFVWIGQERETSIIAGDYVLYFMPGLIMNFTYLVITKYLTNQSVVLPSILFGVAGTAVNALAHYLLVIVGGYGIMGSALSQVAAYAVMNLTALMYIRISGLYKENWSGWSLDSLKDWGQYMSLSIPGLVMTFVEWGSFEVATIISGLLGVVQLDAQTVAFQVTLIIYMIPLGFSIAANIRVGQLLGKGDSVSAKRAAITCLCMVVCTAVVVSTLIASLRNIIPLVFTQDQDVVDVASVILIILAGYEILDSLSSVMAGILRGSGRQLTGAIVLFVGYILVAQPIAISLMFLTSLQTIGFWFGIVAGLVVVNASYGFIFWRMNWENLSLEAQKRTGQGLPQTFDDSLTISDAYTNDEADHDGDDDDTDESALSTNYLKRDVSRREQEALERERFRQKFCRKISCTGCQSSEDSKKYLLFSRGIIALLFLMLLGVGIYLRFTMKVERCIFRPTNGTLPTYNSTLPFCAENSAGYIFNSPN